MQDGLFEMVAGALRLVAGPASTAEQLKQLQSILQQSQEEHAAPQAVADRIEAETPDLAGFASWVRQYLVPKNSGEVTGMISMILAAIALILSLKPQEAPKSFSEKEMATIVEKAVATAITQTSQQKPAPGVAGGTVKGKVKVGRNDPCPCKSGKKYKMCCIGQTSSPVK